MTFQRFFCYFLYYFIKKTIDANTWEILTKFLILKIFAEMSHNLLFCFFVLQPEVEIRILKKKSLFWIAALSIDTTDQWNHHHHKITTLFILWHRREDGAVWLTKGLGVIWFYRAQWADPGENLHVFSCRKRRYSPPIPSQTMLPPRTYRDLHAVTVQTP